MIVTSALIIWKSLMCITGSESPVVVVLSESMEPAFQRVTPPHTLFCFTVFLIYSIYIYNLYCYFVSRNQIQLLSTLICILYPGRYFVLVNEQKSYPRRWNCCIQYWSKTSICIFLSAKVYYIYDTCVLQLLFISYYKFSSSWEMNLLIHLCCLKNNSFSMHASDNMLVLKYWSYLYHRYIVLECIILMLKYALRVGRLNL